MLTRLRQAVQRPAAEAANILGVRAIVPVDFEGWTTSLKAPTRCARPLPATNSPTAWHSPSREPSSVCDGAERSQPRQPGKAARRKESTNAMLSLAGTYTVLATEPDGDSIRFTANNPEA
jgi:hypothetical protein